MLGHQPISPTYQGQIEMAIGEVGIVMELEHRNQWDDAAGQSLPESALLDKRTSTVSDVIQHKIVSQNINTWYTDFFSSMLGH